MEEPIGLKAIYSTIDDSYIEQNNPTINLMKKTSFKTKNRPISPTLDFKIQKSDLIINNSSNTKKINDTITANVTTWSDFSASLRTKMARIDNISISNLQKVCESTFSDEPSIYKLDIKFILGVVNLIISFSYNVILSLL
jgi:hypothetical protein